MKEFEKYVNMSYSTGGIIVHLTENAYTQCNINELNKQGIGMYIRKEILDAVPDYLYPIIQDRKIGFINSYADIVIPPVYDNFMGRFSSVKSLITVFKDGMCGLLNSDGREILMGEYKNISVIDDKYAIVTTKDNQNGIIEMIPNKAMVEFGLYDNIEHINNILIASKGRLKGLISSTGRLLTPIKYKWISNIECGLLRVIVENREKDGIETKWGIIDTNGNEIFPVICDRISQISDKHVIELTLGDKQVKIDIITDKQKF